MKSLAEQKFYLGAEQAGKEMMTGPLLKRQKETNLGWAPAAHTCNPSYSGGRHQEDRSSKSAWANISQDPVTCWYRSAAGRCQGSLPLQARELAREAAE
jgi:hypothetical protein